MLWKSAKHGTGDGLRAECDESGLVAGRVILCVYMVATTIVAGITNA